MEENSEKKPEIKAKSPCLNCGKNISINAKFCPQCGQKTSSIKVRMSDMLWKLWMTTFHLDNKFFRAIVDMAIPSKISIAFFNGKVKRYPHPLQFFFVCFFFLLFFVSFKNKNNDRAKLSLFQLFGEHSAESLKGKIELINTMQSNWDSLPKNLQTAENRVVVDSLIGISSKKIKIFIEDSTDLKSFIPFSNIEKKIYYGDLLNLSPDSILTKYNITDFRDKLFLRQSLKTAKDTKGVMEFYIGSFAWMIFGQILAMSGWLMLLYFRQKRFYVEHFVLQLHTHTFAIVLILFLSILKYFNLTTSNSYWIPFAWFFGGMYYALWRFYGQSWRRTLLKWFLYCFFYCISLLFLFIINLIISFLLF
jgi:hypothetical protein